MNKKIIITLASLSFSFAKLCKSGEEANILPNNRFTFLKIWEDKYKTF